MTLLTRKEQKTVNNALAILSGLFRKSDAHISNPEQVKKFCRLQISHLEHEVFGVLFLNHKNHLLAYKNLFRGTIGETPVYTREVAREALALNASALIFTHNHPSQNTNPSKADLEITTKLIDAMELLDICVLDHIIVSPTSALSFAESGLL
ncbi:MAG: DNA repair protein RadC [Gammaproteobacteria bacterium]|nr:DNA repair protein RadC [Gammaproteobacteria bacterium]